MLRFHGFDYVRAAGMLAVVYIHGCDTNDVARRGMRWLGFAVPCFFMISAFLTQHAIFERATSYRRVIGRRFERLAKPYFAWTAVYLVVRSAKAALAGESLDSGLLGAIFWGDAAHQLYFVPMLFYLFVGWTGVMLLARRRQLLAAVLCFIAIAAALVFEPVIDEILPADRWFVGKNLIWFPIGILAALLVKRFDHRRSIAVWPAVIALLLALTTGPNLYCFALAVLALGIVISRRPPRWVNFLSKYSFGVYLVHVLLIEAMQFASPRIGLELSSLPVTLGVIAVAAVGSYAICGLLGRYPATKWSVT